MCTLLNITASIPLIDSYLTQFCWLLIGAVLFWSVYWSPGPMFCWPLYWLPGGFVLCWPLYEVTWWPCIVLTTLFVPRVVPLYWLPGGRLCFVLTVVWGPPVVRVVSTSQEALFCVVDLCIRSPVVALYCVCRCLGITWGPCFVLIVVWGHLVPCIVFTVVWGTPGGRVVLTTLLVIGGFALCWPFIEVTWGPCCVDRSRGSPIVIFFVSSTTLNTHFILFLLEV